MRVALLVLTLVLTLFACRLLSERRESTTDRIVIFESTRHAAFSSIVNLGEDEMMVVFRHGKAHVSPDGVIAAVRSRDGGKTWSLPDTLIRTTMDCRDPSINRLGDGTLVLNFFQSAYDGAGKIIGAVGVYVSLSHDDGHSWSPCQKLLIPNVEWAACSAKIIPRRDGVLLLPFYGGVKGRKSISGVVFSEDGGRTWLKSRLISSDSTQRLDFQEPVICELPDGRLLCVSRTAGDGHAQYQSYSIDGGESWSPAVPMNIQGQACDLFLTGDNILLCGYRDFSPKGVSYSISYDFGKTWEQERVIETFSRDRAYIEFVALADRRIFVCYYLAGIEFRGIYGKILAVNPPLPPNDFRVHRQTDGFFLSWGRSPETHYYRLFRQYGASTPDSLSSWEWLVETTEQHYRDERLLAGHRYRYRIEAVASSSDLIEHSGAVSDAVDSKILTF